MTDFGQIGFTPEQIDVLGAAQKFCRERSSMEKVRALLETDAGYDADIWQEIAALGWIGVAVPGAYGGAGLSLTECVPIIEQMGRNMMAMPFMQSVLGAQLILAAGSEAQKSAILPDIVSGAVVSLALSEKDGDWDLTQIKCLAAPHETGYRLSGTKVLAMYAAQAKYIIISVMFMGRPCLAVINGADIPRGQYRREILIDESKRSYELDLSGVTIPKTALLGSEHTPAALARLHLAANLLGSAEMTGVCQACIDYTVEYLGVRKQFGKLIGSFQALKHPIVDAFIEYQKSRSLLYSAAYSFDDPSSGEIATRMAKVQADKAFSYAADRAIQFHGGFGFTYECDAQLYRRRAVFLASQYGNGRFHKNELSRLIF